MLKQLIRNYGTIGCLASSTLFVFGCSSGELQPLEGRVLLKEGTFPFSGDTIELRSETDSSSHAFGEIKSDGTFTIESLQAGNVVHGASPGAYAARIVISDDDYDHKKLAVKSIHKKYLQFETSGWRVQVPTKGLTLEISKP